MYQWDKIENPEINLHIYVGNWFLMRETKQFNGGEGMAFSKGAGAALCPHAKE